MIFTDVHLTTGNPTTVKTVLLKVMLDAPGDGEGR
jgi:hypothetical protein